MPASSDRRIPVAANMAIMAASRRCWNDRPAQARSSRGRGPPARTRGGPAPAGEARGGPAGDVRRSQPGHRVTDLLLGGEPLEELLQRAELVAGVRGAV